MTADEEARIRAKHEWLMRKWAGLAAGSWRGIRFLGVFSISYAFGCMTVLGMRDARMLPWGLGLFVAGVYSGIAFLQWRWQGMLDAQCAFFERSGNELLDHIRAHREGQGDG